MSDHDLIAIHSVPGAWLPLTQKWLHDQVRCLPAFVRSHVVCDRIEHRDAFTGPVIHAAGPVRSTPRWRRALLRQRHREMLVSTARSVGGDLLHSHFAPEGWRNLRAARMLDIPHVVSFYGYDVDQLPRTHPRWRRRYARLFDRVDQVLCEAEHMAGRIQRLGCPESKLRVHRLGVDLEALPFRPRTWSRQRTLRVLLAAAFREKKGLPDALEALSALTDEVDLTITLVGDAADDDASRAEQARIEAVLDRTGLRRRTRCLGFIAHEALIREAYEHHVHVAASRTAADGDSEGGAPVTIIQLAATGMPIVSTDHADIPGVVRSGRTGYLARAGDVADLSDQLRRMLARSGRWLPMLLAGRKRIEERFDAATQGVRLGELYARLVTGGIALPAGGAAPKPSGRRAA